MDDNVIRLLPKPDPTAGPGVAQLINGLMDRVDKIEMFTVVGTYYDGEPFIAASNMRICDLCFLSQHFQNHVSKEVGKVR